MKKFKASRKRDDRLMIMMGLIVLIGLLISFFLPNGKIKSNYEIKDLPDSFDADFSKLVISEIVSSNSGVYVDDYNDSCDYLELYNGTDKDIDLNGYGLSDDGKSVKWTFPTVIIRSHEYLVANLNDKVDNGLSVPFKLSSGGKEKVILTNNRGKVIDGVETVELSKNQAMVRDEKGGWYISNYATPGFENSVKGKEDYYSSLISSEESDLIINELLVRNKGNFINEYDEMVGFVELKNISDHAVNLKDYCISDSREVCFRKKLDDVVLKSGECCLYYLEDNKVYSEAYLGFDFAGSNGVAVLSKNGKIVNAVEYSDLENGFALQYNNGSYSSNAIVSPGFENDADGIEKAQKKYLPNRKGLVINEVMTDNRQYLAQNGGKYYDWIELYNNSDESIDLGDYYVSTSAKDLKKYRLKDITLNAHSYYILMCSGDVNLSNDSYDHASFKLSDNESIYLSDGKKTVDCVFVGSLPYGYSYQRADDYGFYYSSEPTPKYNNSSGARSISSTPTISISGGVYNGIDKLTVEISGPQTIYYTTDGSTPTTSSNVYQGPLSINETTVLKARCFQDDMKASLVAYESYIINENHQMPVMSVSMNPSDYEYVRNNAWTEGLKKQAYVEFYEEDGSFRSPCSYSLFGGNARSYAKKSFCLRFSREYGASDIHYPLFDNRDFSVFDAIVLRTGSSDWDKSIIRDVLGTSLVDDGTDLDVLAYKPCVVYINGNYFGIFNIREKTSAEYIASHYNIPEDNINIIRAADSDITCGSKKDYDNLRSYCRNHDLSIRENYEYVLEHIDAVNFADYWVAEGFVCNNDLLNVRLFMSPDLDGKWRYIFYDLDFAYYNYDRNWYTEYIGHSGGYTNHSFENDIIYALLKNSDFRKLFVERLSYAMNTYFSEESFIKRMDEITGYYASEIERDHKAWGLTMAQYENGLDDLKNFIHKRYYYYLRDTKSYFNLSDTQMRDYFRDLWK